MRLVIGEVRCSGKWIEPDNRGNTYEWDVVDADTRRIVFSMVSDDLDYKYRMTITNNIINVVNKDHDNGRSLSSRKGETHRGRWQRFLDYCSLYQGDAHKWRDTTGD